MDMEKDKDYTDIRNAWKVEFRYKKRGKIKATDWASDCSFPAVDIIEYDGEKMRPRDGAFDIGQGRAYVHANWLEARDARIETRVTFVGVKPWWVKNDEDPQKEFVLLAKYDSRIAGG